MQRDQEYLTENKYNQLKNELEFLKSSKRKEIAQNLEYAKSLGDLSENQEYHEARDAQAILEERISYLERILKSAVIVSTHGTDTISVGSVVTVEREADQSKKTFTLVGSEEADASQGKISVKSPLGLGTIGKRLNETFSFPTPNGIMTYKVIDIK